MTPIFLSIPILTDVIIILGLSIPVILLLHYLKLPSIVGFLITGVLVGPHVFGIITDQEEIDILAEIGVILLLFTIGLEFSVPNLLKIKKIVFFGGGLQLLLTTTAFGLITYFREYDEVSIAVFYGFLCTLSSTAIVLKILQIRNEMKTEHGQVIMAILIFQDIAVVPAMLLMPMLTGQAQDIAHELLLTGLKAVVVIFLLILIAKYLIKWFLNLIVATQSKELFISTIVVFCFAIAYLTNLAGLSLALGAFLAGLVISESEHSHQAAEYVLPFKEVFTSIFFVSIGMLMDINFLWNNLFQILYYAIESIFVQAMMAFIAVRMLKIPLKSAILTALAICQIGEFAFILARSGTEIGLMPIELYQYFLAVSVLTMAFAPILIMNSGYFTKIIINIKTKNNTI